MPTLPTITSARHLAGRGALSDDLARGMQHRPGLVEVTPGSEPRPTKDAVALAAELVGASPSRPGRRAVLTSKGLVAVVVVDRFTERTIDLHWGVIADALVDDSSDLLDAFQDVRVDGHQLAFRASQLRRKPVEREEKV